MRFVLKASTQMPGACLSQVSCHCDMLCHSSAAGEEPDKGVGLSSGTSIIT